MQIWFILCLSYFLGIVNGQKYSSLQISDYSISLTFSFEQFTYLTKTFDSYYELTIKISTESDDIPSIIYCWRNMKTVPQKGQQNCDLIHNQQFYRCIQINYTRPNPYDYDGMTQNITTTWTQFNFSAEKGILQIGNSNPNIFINQTVENLTRNIFLNKDYFQLHSIYHMITTTQRDILLTYQDKKTEAKLSFVHTYLFYDLYDSLINQRNYYCIMYSNKIIYIFEGAVSRGGQLHFFTGILTTTNNNISFDMWGGYSYSSGHAARDMMGYQSNTQNYYDMYSLYAAAPFQDIADNVKGTKNVVRIGNSGSSSSVINQTIKQMIPPFHFIQFYRLFDTTDTNGDQIIQDKIYNRFCYAAYFQDINDTNPTSNLSVLSNSFKHQLIDCHIPELSIFQSNLMVKLIFTLASFILILY